MAGIVKKHPQQQTKQTYLYIINIYLYIYMVPFSLYKLIYINHILPEKKKKKKKIVLRIEILHS